MGIIVFSQRMNFRLAFCLLLSMCWLGCANIGYLDGGEKDTQGPYLIKAVPQDSSLNIKPKKIEFYFDEYIQVSDVSTEVKISPLLPYPHTMLVTGKKAVLSVPDSVLLPNTTYTISFGSAIKDIREGNAFQNYTYRFSTGQYFDSLKLNGKVLQARTGLPLDAASVLLYAVDTIKHPVLKKKPLYITTTNIQGVFTFEGLPLKEFKIYALKESNNNYQFDAVDEEVAFYEKVVLPNQQDSTDINLFSYKKNIEDTSLVTTSNSGKFGNSQLDNRGEKKDFAFNINVDTSNRQKGTFDLNDTLKITFNKKPFNINSERITLTQTINDIEEDLNPSIVIDTHLNGQIKIIEQLKPNSIYTLRLLTNLITDSSGNSPLASKYTFRTMREEDYGSITCVLPKDSLQQQIIMEVYKDDQLVKSSLMKDSSVTFNRLKPGKYAALFIVDKNKNGHWDPGDMEKDQLPERVYRFPVTIDLKAGWTQIMDFVPPKKNK